MSHQKKLSRSAYNRLKAELNEIITVKLPWVEEATFEARQMGKIEENADYWAVKEEEGKIRERQRYLEDTLRESLIVEDGDLPSDVVGHGSLITVQFDGDDDTETYLVASIDERVDVPVCSPTSPMGKAVLGAKAGQTIRYQTSNGVAISVTVVSIDA
jgi:transcription elongation factor GreA